MADNAKKRRSSFSAGRLKLQQSGVFGGDLHQSIDMNRLQEERLALLTKACLQYALEKAEEEITDIEDFPSLRKELEEAGLRRIAEMEQTGDFKKASENRSCLPNPVNLEMDQTIIEMETRIKRLEEMMVTWEEYIKKLDEETEEFQKKSRIISEAEIPPHICRLSEQYMAPKLDYTAMVSDLDTDMMASKFHINKYCLTTKALLQATQTATHLLDRRIQRDAEKFRGTTSLETPRRLIQQIVDQDFD